MHPNYLEKKSCGVLIFWGHLVRASLSIKTDGLITDSPHYHYKLFQFTRLEE